MNPSRTSMIALVVSSALLFAFFNAQILLKERTRTSGELVLLELAPVDPRSLMQGDYMTLRYAIASDVISNIEQAQDRGDTILSDVVDVRRRVEFVARLDADGVARFARIGSDADEGEVTLVLKRIENRWSVGASSFFFQEGHAEIFEDAKYGELRVQGSEMLLVGLRDENRQPLGPPRW